jgi:S1-C subfamily serine protease
MSRLIPIIGGAVAGAVVAVVIANGSTSHSNITTTVFSKAPGTSIPSSFSTASKGLSINQIYRSDSPGVVDITVTSNSSNGGFGPLGGTQQTQGEGAGVVYDTKGDILTDEHVVSGATKVTVQFQDGRKASAKVLGTDSSTDVGVIHVNVPSSELHPIAFADSSTAQVGDPVVAIGSPFSLPETTTAGIISAVGRSIQAPNNYQIPGAIQTDAAINPGNSGGPLLDASGHVLGLNDQIQTNSGSSAGVGFATPSNAVARIANSIIGGHPVKHSYVGVELNGASTGGARVSQIQPNSPATSAGLQPGDLITAVNGKTITTTEQFIATVDGYGPGQTVTMTIQRGGQTKTISLKLGTRPAASPTGG